MHNYERKRREGLGNAHLAFGATNFGQVNSLNLKICVSGFHGILEADLRNNQIGLGHRANKSGF